MRSRTLFTTVCVATATLAAAAGIRGSTRLDAQQPAHRYALSARTFTPSGLRAMAQSQDSTLYTEEQATAGAEIYTKTCTECHEKADVTSADFKAKWAGRPVQEFYELIRTTMPDGNPGALSRDDYAKALAYIFKLNGLPAGATAVMPDSAMMSAAKIVFPAGGN
ncbi:MAG: cytochrome c [Gemmatimonadaceae bacterium]|nr:cytochrome c [Gemmatimonadaceae bacterium]